MDTVQQHIKTQLEMFIKPLSDRKLIKYLMVTAQIGLAILPPNIQTQAFPLRSTLQDLNKATMVILHTVPGNLLTRPAVHTITRVLGVVHQILVNGMMALDMAHTA
jgi:hypothetical protein